jgi:hypothetical protein
MGTAEIVGAMGLTFFCNRCVEAFYTFKKSGIVTQELKNICGEAISAFKSLDWISSVRQGSTRVALFNTNEEVQAFAKVIEAQKQEADDAINILIEKLESIIDIDTATSKKQRTAGELQRFFDMLGNYSFYATRDCIRTSGTMVGI